jgi:spermidine/putrescine transport system ATP-binding protein
MQLELKRIQHEVGITFIYVTHDQEEAMTMSNRLAVMRHGRVEQIGPPQDVYEYPTTEFVAGFLGASNLLEGEVGERTGEAAVIRLSGGDIVTVPASHLDGDRGAVKVGVRPEKIRLQSDPGDAPAGWNSVHGVVRMSTFVGVGHQYNIDGPDGAPLTVYAQNLGAEPVPHPGEHVRLLWRPEHTFVVRPSVPLAEEEEEQ